MARRLPLPSPSTWMLTASCMSYIQSSITRISTDLNAEIWPEVSVPRILGDYRRYGLKQTFFVPAWCIEQYPMQWRPWSRTITRSGYHGFIHEAPNALSRDEEHYWMQRSIEVIAQHWQASARRAALCNYSIHTATSNGRKHPPTTRR